MPKPSIPGISSPKLQRRKRLKIHRLLDIISKSLKKKKTFRTYPWMPFFGGLLLNWRVCLCLNLGGPLRGVAGPPLTRVADLISALGSRFILSCYVTCVQDRGFRDARWSRRDEIFSFGQGEGNKSDGSSKPRWLFHLFSVSREELKTPA